MCRALRHFQLVLHWIPLRLSHRPQRSLRSVRRVLRWILGVGMAAIRLSCFGGGGGFWRLMGIRMGSPGCVRRFRPRRWGGWRRWWRGLRMCRCRGAIWLMRVFRSPTADRRTLGRCGSGSWVRCGRAGGLRGSSLGCGTGGRRGPMGSLGRITRGSRLRRCLRGLRLRCWMKSSGLERRQWENLRIGMRFMLWPGSGDDR